MLLFYQELKMLKIQNTKDILQEVFVRIHLQIHTLKDPKKVQSWIFQIANRQIVDHFRNKKLTQPLSISEFEIKEDSPKYFKKICRCLEPFARQLKPIYRDALLETNFGTSSLKQYAESHHLSYSTVKSRIQRARKQLKELFSSCCVLAYNEKGEVYEKRNKACTCASF